VARHALERGISLLAVDLLGDGTGATFEEMAKRNKPERAIEPILDYLAARDDVDERRIAILGDGSSPLLSRAASPSIRASPLPYATAASGIFMSALS